MVRVSVNTRPRAHTHTNYTWRGDVRGNGSGNSDNNKTSEKFKCNMCTRTVAAADENIKPSVWARACMRVNENGRECVHGEAR